MKVDIPRKGRKKSTKLKAGKKQKSKARPKPAADSGLTDALRAWRMAEAKRRRVPAFRIFPDKALEAIAASRPDNAAALLAMPGIGMGAVEKYGAAIYRLVQQFAQ